MSPDAARHKKVKTMWVWWNGYFTAWRQVLEMADWTEATIQVFATLLGGILSLVVALIAISKQEKRNRKKEEADAKRAAENAVNLAVNKVLEYGEILGGLRNLLDGQFRQAAAEGYGGEPYQIVRPTQGQDYPPRPVDLSEILFLTRSDDVQLISDIALVYRRTLNCIHMSQVHSRDRVAFSDWIQALPGHTGELLGDIAKDSIPIEFVPMFERRAANLNLIIASLVEQLEDTIPLLEEVLVRLGKACKAEFGKDFSIYIGEFPATPISGEEAFAAYHSHLRSQKG